MTAVSQPRSSHQVAAPPDPSCRVVSCWSDYKLAKRWTIALLGLLLAAVAFRLSAVEGIVSGIRVSGPSMGPTLWGPHRPLQCDACGAVWRIHDQQGTAPPRSLPCWNCGAAVDPRSSPLAIGDTVWIDRGAYWWRSPRRGELVAIASSDGSLRVKRIVAVAGDHVTAAGGDLRVNGRSIAAVIGGDAIAWLPVHDDAYRGPRGSRWQHADGSAWITMPQGFAWHGLGQQQYADAWLSYAHLAVHDGLRPDQIRDDDPANANIARRLVAVDDLRLSGRITASGATTIDVAFWLPDGIHRLRQRVPAGRHLWSVDTLSLTAADEQRGRSSGASDAAAPPVTAQRPVAMRLQGPAASLDRLRIERPVRWSIGAADASLWSDAVTLPHERYFVVGDNQPVSVDSRSDPSGITAQQIIGRVLPRNGLPTRAPSG